MERAMSELLVKNLAAVGVIAFGVMSALFMMTTLFMTLGMLAGEWALLHVLAMLGMAVGCMVLTACCMAVCEFHGNAFWRGKDAD